MEDSITYSSKAFVGQRAPDFTMASTKNLQTLEESVSLADYQGKWLVLLFYPLDFTFVCPTELRGFSERYEEFRAEGAEVLGVSVDSVHTHRAWIKAPRRAAASVSCGIRSRATSTTRSRATTVCSSRARATRSAGRS